MKPTPEEQNPDEALLTRWMDGQLDTAAEQSTLDRLLAVDPGLSGAKDGAERLGRLLRSHLPATLEPPSADFFTSRLMREIESEALPVAAVAKRRASPAGVANVRWWQAPWFAPLASAAAVAALFLAVNGGPALSGRPSDAARAYAPDPKVVASAFFSNEAEATVIDLAGLQAVPDSREIRAFDLASAEPAVPGRPAVYFAVSDPDRPVLVMNPDTANGPALRELH